MISIALARRSREQLAALGYRVQWHEYPMPHSVCMEEIAAISGWLQQVLDAPD